MKVLNRPMFRYGGPIKEGIMSGIKEPRQRYQDAGAVFKNVENLLTTNQPRGDVLQGAVELGIASPYKRNVFKPYMKKTVTPPTNLNKNIAAADDFSELSTDFATTIRDPESGRMIMQEPQGLSLEAQAALNRISASEYAKLKKERDAENLKSKADGTVTTQGKSPFAYTADEVIEEKGKLPGDTEPTPLPTKKERVNTILESLGYDRAQKNALYDAMIKAGQRISRTGLGAENLVSDVIAETSQSYDKPEKLREAANLMDAQQQLKLEQIEASKSNKTEEDFNFYVKQFGGGEEGRKKALRMLTKDAQSETEAYLAAKKSTGSGLDGVKAGIEWMIRDGQIGENENKGEISKKSYDNIKEFVASDEFKRKGPGVYQLEGIVARIDADGSVDIIKSFGTISEKTSSWFGFGS